MRSTLSALTASVLALAAAVQHGPPRAVVLRVAYYDMLPKADVPNVYVAGDETDVTSAYRDAGCTELRLDRFHVLTLRRSAGVPDVAVVIGPGTSPSVPGRPKTYLSFYDGDTLHTHIPVHAADTSKSGLPSGIFYWWITWSLYVKADAFRIDTYALPAGWTDGTPCKKDMPDLESACRTLRLRTGPNGCQDESETE